MKKIVSLVLVALMLSLSTSAFAKVNAPTLTAQEPSTSDNQTQGPSMEQAIISVKGKIEVPASLDIFESSTQTNNDKVNYNFTWRDKDYKSSLQVTCDDKGRITDFNYYSDSFKSPSPGKKLPTVSKGDAIKKAEAFLRKSAPEAFKNDNDKFVLDEKLTTSSVYDNGTLFNFTFNRIKDGVIVKNNDTTINLQAVNNNIYVTNIHIGYDYNASFEDKTSEISDGISSYKKAFPVEMIYEKQYIFIPYRSEMPRENNKIDLIYRIKDNNIGFISAYTGEIVKADSGAGNYYYNTKDAAAEKSMAGSSPETALTEAEIAELKNVSELKTANEIEQALRNIKVLKLDKSLKLTESRISKNNDIYVLNLNLNSQNEKNYHNLSASVDAKTGKLLSIYNYIDNYSKDELTDKQKETSQAAVTEFLESYAPDELKQCIKLESDSSSNNYSVNYTRLVNDVPYVNNGISISYDGLNDVLTNYNLNFDTKGDFKDPKGAITKEDAYDKIFKVAPLQKMYVLSDGNYKLCYSVDSRNYIRIDALTGEQLPIEGSQSPQNSGNYTDIGGHWCEEAVKKLAEVGIALAGNQFMPDSEIMQEDLLKLFAAGLNYTGYLYYDADTLYENLYNSYVLTKEERNESAPVTREDSYVFMIRLAGLERVAKLPKIFKVDFADKDTLSKDRIGYAAILSGLNVISGDGGYLRAQDKITRAEAAQMVYNYLLN